MRKIIIVGAGGLGREIMQWVKDFNFAYPNRALYIKGFIDDNIKSLDGYDCEYDIIGNIQDWKPNSDEVFACAFHDPAEKERAVSLLKSKGAVFETIIHPSAVVCENSRIGEGFIAYPNCYVSVNVKIGDFVTIMASAIGYDAQIGDYTTICSECGISGKIKIGKSVFVGNNAVILTTRNIGDFSHIAPGSVVMTNLKPNSKVMGNPAKQILF